MRQDFERLFKPETEPRSGFPRLPTIAAEAIVATSHPLATQAGMRAFAAGGNAVDAALAAAAVLPVVEPNLNGVGGDAFAIVWNDGEAQGLNGSGRSPQSLDAPRVDRYGPRSVTVPGAVAAWFDLAERFGRLGFDQALGHAADLALAGVAATPRVGALWERAEALGRAPFPAPGIGRRYRLPELGHTLRRLAAEGPAAFYTGEVARAIAEVTWLDESDLGAHRSEWVEPLRLPFRGFDVYELPPNTQGAAALAALRLIEQDDSADPLERLDLRIRATAVALAEAHAAVGDAPLPPDFLDYARLHAVLGTGAAVTAPLSAGDTTYLCAVDADRLAISLIQSNYEGFGSGLVAPGTGVPLQNRGAGFVEQEGHPNQLQPGKRPFHTIIPGLIVDDGRPGPFGIMGGHMQAQAHMQVVDVVTGLAFDPQSALDRARFRIDQDGTVALEPGLWELAEGLERRGHRIVRADQPGGFGVGQMILDLGESLIAGSDSRADGHAAGM